MYVDLPLLRSVIAFPGDPVDAVYTNLMALRREVALEGLDLHIVGFAATLADKTLRGVELALLKQHYQQLTSSGDSNGMPGLLRLTDVESAGLPFQGVTEYRYALDQYRERVLSDGIGVLLQQASHIITSGYLHKPVKGPQVQLKGSLDAVNYLRNGITDLASHFKSGDIEGTLRDLQQVVARYQQRVGMPQQGVLTGYKTIDDAHYGFKPGDLAMVLGYTGQMKTTLTMNIVYHVCVWYGQNAGVLSMESSITALQDMLAVIHCHHRKFSSGLVSITFERLKRGLLDSQEEQLLAEATHDLATCPDYGQMVYMEPSKAQITVGDIFRWAHDKHQQTPLQLLAIDYLGLIDPDGGGSAMKESAFANMTVRQTKQNAMAFDRGKGIAVLSPWQANRKGFQEATKNGGRYDLTALAWAPEAEKSSDLVYYVYRDETLAASNQLQVGNLKARDRKLIVDSFLTYANADARLIEDIDATSPYQHVMPGLNQP